jgi:heptosyltransferase-2
LFPQKANYDKATAFLETLTFDNKIILIAPGSVWFTKRWTEEKYISLIEKLLELDYVLILSGSPAEKTLCENIQYKVKKLIPEKSHLLKNICGEYDLLDSAALIDKVELVICNDSGTLHIANAMNTPVYAFFGPTVQNIGYFPYREKDFVFEINLNCRPCGSHGGVKCPKKHFKCMELITVEMVLNKINRFFDAQKTDE